jgi:signal transduction histidine kinase
MLKAINPYLPQSIRARLAFYFILAFGTTLVLTSALCFQIFVRTHQENFDASLYNHAIDVASAIDPNLNGGIEFHPFSALDFEKHNPFSVGRSYMELRDPGGRYIGSSANLSSHLQLPFSDQIRNKVLNTGVDYTTIKGPDVGEKTEIDYRLISYLVSKPGLFPVILQIAVPLTIIQENQKAFLLLLFFLIPSGIVLSTVLALWASRRAFSPVLLMTTQTAQIEVKNLKDRIEVIETDIELKELGRTLNLLLDRVENSVLAQDRFVADASHQLKTPLAIIQGELELLQSQVVARADSPELSGSLLSIQQEVSQLIRLVENLLLLAKMDAGFGEVPFQTVRLDEIVTESVRRYRRLAEQAGLKIVIELSPDLTHSDSQIDFEMSGDAYLLRCLVENLIDNAIKYSKGANLGVTVRLQETASEFILEVEDHGLGLTESELADLFKRFQRDPKKSLQAQGAGLGLVIVKRIAELHHGEISLLQNNPVGTCARVEFQKV